jgi:hypothetical protein
MGISFIVAILMTWSLSTQSRQEDVEVEVEGKGTFEIDNVSEGRISEAKAVIGY